MCVRRSYLHPAYTHTVLHKCWFACDYIGKITCKIFSDNDQRSITSLLQFVCSVSLSLSRILSVFLCLYLVIADKPSISHTVYGQFISFDQSFVVVVVARQLIERILRRWFECEFAFRCHRLTHRHLFYSKLRVNNSNMHYTSHYYYYYYYFVADSVRGTPFSFFFT